MKTCTKCGRDLPAEAFSKKKASKDGLRAVCKDCDAERNAKYYAENAEKVRERQAKYYAENAEKVRECKAKYRADNPEKERGRQAKYYAENAEKVRECKAKYRADNPEKERGRQAKYYAENAEKVRERQAKYYARKRAEFLAANPGYVPKFGFNPDKPGAFYLLRIESMIGDFIGYGITNDIKRRMAEHRCTLKDIGARIVEEHFIPFDRGYDAVAVEQLMDEHAAGRLHLDAEGFKTESFPGGEDAYQHWLGEVLDLAGEDCEIVHHDEKSLTKRKDRTILQSPTD